MEKVKWDEFLVPVINVADTMIHSITFPLHLPAFTINYRPGPQITAMRRILIPLPEP